MRRHSKILRSGRGRFALAVFVAFGSCLNCGPSAAIGEETPSGTFQEVLELAGIEPEVFGKFSLDSPVNQNDWQLIGQLLYRLNQFPESQLKEWAVAEKPDFWNRQPSDDLGTLVMVSAVVESVETVPLPEDFSAREQLTTLIRCRARSEQTGAFLQVLVPQVPQSWKTNAPLSEPVRFVGILLHANSQEPLLLTRHLAWAPRERVSRGQLLLAKHGMDVSLFDEVRHRQPFVKRTVSREADAFYDCLAALRKVDPAELASLVQQDVAEKSAHWAAQELQTRRREKSIRRQLASDGMNGQREPLQRKLATVRRMLALGSAVQKQAEQIRSSVAPLFLQPEKEVGELVRIEGIVRRAVRVFSENRDGTDFLDLPAEVPHYFELDVFTPDSQNLPVVCCVSRLPAGFPEGDKIREPIRVDGVFFKSWRYRSRKNLSPAGETGRQQQRYTPVVLGSVPTRLAEGIESSQRWGLWGGVTFLAALAAVWVVMICWSQRDRKRRAAQQPTNWNDFPNT